jgi:hypothetical protein
MHKVFDATRHRAKRDEPFPQSGIDRNLQGCVMAFFYVFFFFSPFFYSKCGIMYIRAVDSNQTVSTLQSESHLHNLNVLPLQHGSFGFCWRPCCGEKVKAGGREGGGFPVWWSSSHTCIYGLFCALRGIRRRWELFDTGGGAFWVHVKPYW